MILSTAVISCSWKLFDSKLILRVNVTENILLIFKTDFNSHELSIVYFSVHMSDMSYFASGAFHNVYCRTLYKHGLLFKNQAGNTA